MPPRKRLRVLVVDDEESVCEMVSEVVRYAGHDVVGMAKNGLEAIVQAAQLQPDIVVMDVHMPQMNGIDAMQALLKAKSTSRVMLLSGGYTSDNLPVDFAHHRGVAFLPKPFDLSAFVRLMDQWAMELS